MTGAEVIGADVPAAFTSGSITLRGSLRVPHADAASTGAECAGGVPAIVLVSGSGPTDRDGNSVVPGYEHLRLDPCRWLADIAADCGWASLRFDKFGSGETRLGPYDGNPAAVSGLSYDELYVEPVRDALRFIASVPGVDAGRLVLVGHSEGALVSLAVGADPGSAPVPVGLALVEPQYGRTFDILQRQINSLLVAPEVSEPDRVTLSDWMQTGIDELRTPTTTLPGNATGPIVDATGLTAQLQATIGSTVYGTLRTRVGTTLDAIDPVALAARWHGERSVLITAGTKDFNTPLVPGGPPGSGVSALASAFAPGSSDLVVLENMVHELRDIGGLDASEVPPADLPDHPFSAQLGEAFSKFLRRLAQGS